MIRNIEDILAQEFNLVRTLAKHAQQVPNKIAYTFVGDSEQHLTFAQLYTEVQILARKLSLYIEANDRVLIALPPSLDFPKALFACFYLGAIAVPFYIPVNNQFSNELVAKITTDAGIKTVLTNLELQHQINGSASVINCLDIENLDTQTSTVDMCNYEIAVLLYTSGSTGDPKGVTLTHRSIIHNMLGLQDHCNLDEDDIILTWLPNSPVAGLYTRLLGIIMGAKTVVFPTLHFLQQPLKWLELISKYKATFSAAPNFAYDLCSQSAPNCIEKLDLQSWKMAISGGEIIRLTTLDRFIQTFGKYGFYAQNFFPYYGSTEGLCITLPRPNHQLKTLSLNREKLTNKEVEIIGKDDERSIVFVSNGSAFLDTKICIVDPETQTKCSTGIVGEVWVSSPCNTKGYWQKKEYSEKTCHVYLGQEGPFYRTGDLGFIDENELYITGRLKELIILNGKNYYPEDIELSALQNTPDYIVSAAAFSVDVDDKESLIVLLGYQNQKPNIEEMINILQKVYSQKHGIRVYGFIVVNDYDIPRASTRKIKRSVCRNYYLDGRFMLVSKKTQAANKFAGLLSLPLESSKLLQNLREYFAYVLEIDIKDIPLEKPIYTLGLDSISMVKILTQLNRHFFIQIPNSIFFDSTSIAKLATMIGNLFYKRKAFDIPVINYDSELQEVQLMCQNLAKKTAKFENIFITGATGFLGSYLLYDLLTTSGLKKIYCLVRAQNSTSALERIKNALPKWQEKFHQRIEIVVGSIDQNLMGLTHEKFTLLAQQVDLIIHNAANVNFVAPYEYLKNTNVRSCLEIIRLATEFQVKPIHFVSTLAVFNSPHRKKIINEDMQIENVNTLYSGYAQSKWVAEKLLLEARKYSLPVSIYRPGIVTGDSKTGYCNTDDFLCRFIKGCIQKQQFPRMNVEIDMTPVDYVSKAIVFLLDKPNNIYHLANPQPIKLTAYVSWLKEQGFKVKLVDFGLWLENLKCNMEDNALFPVLPFVMEKHPVNQETILEFISRYQLNYNCDNTLTQLSQEIYCENVSDKLLHLYISYFQRIGFLEIIDQEVTNYSSHN